jgi:hypothetical protein
MRLKPLSSSARSGLATACSGVAASQRIGRTIAAASKINGASRRAQLNRDARPIIVIPVPDIAKLRFHMAHASISGSPGPGIALNLADAING